MDIVCPLPMSKREQHAQGISQFDFIIINGDAYVDHPSFGAAIIGRLLQSRGFTVGMIAQPGWQDKREFMRLGRPRLAFLVTAGNLDSMVNHYSVNKVRRKTDAYSPGGKAGLRPDRAAIVYANRCKEAFRGVPVILGGLEASLRRLAHYDYWENALRRSILVDSGAELIVYGMGESAIVEIAEALEAGIPAGEITYVNGTCYACTSLENVYDYDCVESFMEMQADKRAYARAFMKQIEEQDPVRGRRLVQAHEKGFVVVNPPAAPLSRQALDDVYALPFTRMEHPSYEMGVPALEEVRFSLTSCRGCFGACAFCALTFHQGRIVQSRSHASLLEEATGFLKQPQFKGYIHDVGGPTANFRQPACEMQMEKGACKHRQCIGYRRCEHLRVDHSDYIALLRKLRALPDVKKVFVRSGVRYDYALYDKNGAFLEELVAHHISGRLKVAPEHVDDRVLMVMNKPSHGLYDRFVERYATLSAKAGMDQHIEPYFISSHPGSDLHAAIALALYLKRIGQRPEQVQDFYPTPGTLSTCMYYTGLDPRTMQPVYVPRTQREKGMQRALMQYFMPKNFAKVREALREAHREDLIGFHKDALVPPEGLRSAGEKDGRAQKHSPGERPAGKRPAGKRPHK